MRWSLVFVSACGFSPAAVYGGDSSPPADAARDAAPA
jgi:hypothetical protein